MDDRTPPSATELGVSEAEHAQILRRLRLPEPAPVPPPTGHASPRRRSWWFVLVLAGLVLGVALPSLGGGDDAQQEPAYAFLQAIGDRPVAYTSCRQIQVAVYPAGGPPDAEELVRDAVARVRAASGLDIVVVGAFGGYPPNWNFEAAPVHPDDPISVSWQDGDAIRELTDHVAGLGGSRTVGTPDGGLRRVAGTIALSRDYYAELTESGDRAEQLAVMLHELGHVLGLDHVESPGELMYSDNIGRTTFGPGDLEGLRPLGQGPCY